MNVPDEWFHSGSGFLLANARLAVDKPVFHGLRALWHEKNQHNREKGT
jgi:hypothetical protein